MAMSPLVQAQIEAYKAAGWEVRLNNLEDRPSACAYVYDDGTRVIEMFGDPSCQTWLLTFLHEVAHHVLGHCDGWSSEPDWSQEFKANSWALQMIAALTPDDLDACTSDAQNHMRGVLQPWVQEWGAERLPWDMIAWAGCYVPPYLRHHLPQGKVSLDHGRLLIEIERMKE